MVSLPAVHWSCTYTAFILTRVSSWMGSKIFRELVRHAVVELVGEILVVAVGVALVPVERADVARLHVVSAGHIRRRRVPPDRLHEVGAPGLRAIGQALDISVVGTPGRALLGHGNQGRVVPRHLAPVPVLLVRGQAGFEQQLRRGGSRPPDRLHATVGALFQAGAAGDGARFGRARGRAGDPADLDGYR